jgi:hypothetical protein
MTGMWGGTECLLSCERASRKRGQGTFFRLARLKSVAALHVTSGKLTVVIPYQTRVCHVFIQITEDVKQLAMVSAMLRNSDSCSRNDIEVKVVQLVGKSKRNFAYRPSDIDIVYGFGFPPFRRGPCHYADFLGLPAVVAGMEKYNKALGDDTFMKPCALLVELAKSGRKFADLNKN